MKTNESATILSSKLHTIAEMLDPSIERTVLEMTGRICRHVLSHRGILTVVLKEVSGQMRSEMLDRVMTPTFLDILFPELDTLPRASQDEWRRTVSFAVRRFAPDLKIPISAENSKVPFIAWASGAGLGAFAGVTLSNLLNLNPDTRLSIAMALAPLCALAGVSIIQKISRKTSLINWIANIRSAETLNMAQLEYVTKQSIESWLSSLLVLTYLTGKLLPPSDRKSASESEKMPDNLLVAIQKLIVAPFELREKVTDEVIQEFFNAGYSWNQTTEEVVWKDELEEQFDVLGLVREGDRCRILANPVLHDGQLQQKGRLTRIRSRS